MNCGSYNSINCRRNFQTSRKGTSPYINGESVQFELSPCTRFQTFKTLSRHDEKTNFPLGCMAMAVIEDL